MLESFKSERAKEAFDSIVQKGREVVKDMMVQMNKEMPPAEFMQLLMMVGAYEMNILTTAYESAARIEAIFAQNAATTTAITHEILRGGDSQ